jgi:hypothetical protein
VPSRSRRLYVFTIFTQATEPFLHLRRLSLLTASLCEDTTWKRAEGAMAVQPAPLQAIIIQCGYLTLCATFRMRRRVEPIEAAHALPEW